MPSMSPSFFNSDRSEGEIDLVMDDDEVCYGRIAFAQNQRDGRSALVHVGPGLGEEDCFGIDAPRADEGMIFIPDFVDGQQTGKFIRCHETGIVACTLIFSARISKSDDNFHSDVEQISRKCRR